MGRFEGISVVEDEDGTKKILVTDETREIFMRKRNVQMPDGSSFQCPAYACKDNDPFGRTQFREFLFLLQDAHLGACGLKRADFEQLKFDQQQGRQKLITTIPATFVAYYLFRVRIICFYMMLYA
jgi:hypothetical protein